MPFTVAQLLCALLLPVALAALLTVVARDLRDAAVGCMRVGLGGLMLILTIAVAHVATAMAVDARVMPPLLGWHWLPWAALAVVPLMVLALPRRLTGATAPTTLAAGVISEVWRWLLVAMVTAAGAWLVLRAMPFSDSFTLFHLAGGLTAAALVTIASGILSSPIHPSPLLDRVTAVICSGGIAIGILATGSKDLALLAGIIPAAIIGGSFNYRTSGPWTGGLLVTAMITSWHLLIAASYSELPWWNTPVFALALPAALAAARLGTTPKRRAWWQIGTALLVIAIALALAATLGQPTTQASDEPSYRY